MVPKNQAELGKFIDLLRRKGVSSIELPDFKLSLASHVPESKYKRKQVEELKIEADPTFTEDAALYWSSAGLPDAMEAN